MKPHRLLPLLASLALAGCGDFLEEEPQDFFSPANFPAGESDINLALGGIQNYLTRQDYYSRGWWFLSEIPSDHSRVTETSGSRRDHDAFTVVPENEWIRRVWQGAYGAINASNVLIARIPEIENLTEARRAQYLAAAKFWRALNYFNLVRVWGDVPLHTVPVTDVEEARATTRAPLADVYALIASDLEAGCKDLPTSWPEGPGKPTRGAACAALADVYLNLSGEPLKQNRWADAARAAKAVMDLGVHRLRPSFADLWLIANKTDPEFLFSIQFQEDGDGLVNTQSRPSGIGTEAGFNYWNTTEQFMGTFADQDARKDPTFLTVIEAEGVRYTYRSGVPGMTRWGGNSAENHRPYWGKYIDDNRTNHTDRNRRTDNNVPVYRYADVLLMFAEAENEATGPTAAAHAALNQVRERAKLPPLAGLSRDAFRAAVRQERSWELAFEGKRWFDLKRWGTWLTVLSQDPVARTNIKPHHFFAPIPQQELDNSPAITQNPGY